MGSGQAGVCRTQVRQARGPAQETEHLAPNSGRPSPSQHSNVKESCSWRLWSSPMRAVAPEGVHRGQRTASRACLERRGGLPRGMRMMGSGRADAVTSNPHHRAAVGHGEGKAMTASRRGHTQGGPGPGAAAVWTHLPSLIPSSVSCRSLAWPPQKPRTQGSVMVLARAHREGARVPCGPP